MPFETDVVSIAAVALLGLVAGSLGGMLGVGGSIVMIPGLTMLFGREQHLYQAAAMVANVVVSVPASLRHRRAGAVDWSVLKWMLPAALVFMLVGVRLSNLAVFRGSDGGIWLGRIMAAFLAYVIAVNIKRLIHPRLESTAAKRHVSPWGCGASGAGMGVIGGLLGVGGGTIAVPMQQILLHLPLRSCIANSMTVICFTATAGAVYKNATLTQHGYQWTGSLLLAATLAPSCWVGGRIGAGLTHALPLRQVRVAFILLMAAAAVKMAAIPWDKM